MNEVVWVGWEIKFLILKFKLIMDLLGGGFKIFVNYLDLCVIVYKSYF